MSAIEMLSSVATSKPYLLSINLAAFKEDSPHHLSLNKASATTATLNVDLGSAGFLCRLADVVKAMTVITMAATVIPAMTA